MRYPMLTRPRDPQVESDDLGILFRGRRIYVNVPAAA
jgi:hypothetical protein